MMRTGVALVLTLLMALSGLALAGDRDGGLEDRPSVGEPLRFRDASGGAFRPSALVLVMDAGTVRAELPRTADATNQDRVDISTVPVFGKLFEKTLDADSAREGVVVGPVFRVGDQLVVDAAGFPEGLSRVSVVLTTNIPRLGAVSYDVGYLGYGPGNISPQGEAVGSAHIVGDDLVIASIGGEPAYPSVDAFVRDLFN